MTIPRLLESGEQRLLENGDVRILEDDGVGGGDDGGSSTGAVAVGQESSDSALLGSGGPWLIEKSQIILPPHEGGYELGYRPFTMKTSQLKSEPLRRRPNKEMGPIALMLRDS